MRRRRCSICHYAMYRKSCVDNQEYLVDYLACRNPRCENFDNFVHIKQTLTHLAIKLEKYSKTKKNIEEDTLADYLAGADGDKIKVEVEILCRATENLHCKLMMLGKNKVADDVYRLFKDNNMMLFDIGLGGKLSFSYKQLKKFINILFPEYKTK